MDTIRNDLKIENTCGLGNVIGRGGDGDRARKTCDYDTHLTCRRSLTSPPPLRLVSLTITLVLMAWVETNLMKLPLGVLAAA